VSAINESIQARHDIVLGYDVTCPYIGIHLDYYPLMLTGMTARRLPLLLVSSFPQRCLKVYFTVDSHLFNKKIMTRHTNVVQRFSTGSVFSTCRSFFYLMGTLTHELMNLVPDTCRSFLHQNLKHFHASTRNFQNSVVQFKWSVVLYN